MKRFFSLSLLLASIALPTTLAASTQWVEGLGFQARLVNGTLDEKGTYKAGFEVVLQQGWKTYWRVPGENGIPPDFQTAQSSNIADMKIHWPIPILFEDGDGISVGYKNRVMIPFSIKPEVVDQKVDLNMTVFFGVCAEICVPVQETFSVQLDPTETVASNEPLIEEALDLVPVSASEAPVDVMKATLLTVDSQEYVEVDVALPTYTSGLIVLAEGPRGWYFDPVKTSNLKRDHDGHVRTRIPLYRDSKTSISDDQTVRFTIIAGSEAIEKTVRLK